MLVYRFDVCSLMAHFRRAYTNSSAMTYGLPPRTTICGLIANMLGLKRDFYYDVFARDKISIAVACREAFYKLVQKVNYINAENPDEVTGAQGNAAQIRIEFLFPVGKTLRYRIWVALREDFPTDLGSRLHKICENGGYITYGSPLSLGPAYCSAWLENSRVGEIAKTASGQAEIHSAVTHEMLKGVLLRQNNEVYNDEMPLEMKPDRTLACAPVSYIYDIRGVPMLCDVKSYVQLKFGEETENVVWL